MPKQLVITIVSNLPERLDQAVAEIKAAIADAIDDLEEASGEALDVEVVETDTET